MKLRYLYCIIPFIGILGIIFYCLTKPYSGITISPVPFVHFTQTVSSFTPLPLEFNTLFSNDHTWISTVSAAKKRTLVATGDIIPARSVNHQTIKYGDFTWAWKHIAPILKNGDITLINLESPLVPHCPSTVEGMIFCGDQRNIQGILFAGVDVANFANNHMGNYGINGITQTKELLEQNTIGVSGLGEPSVFDVRGMKFVFLGFDDIGPSVIPIATGDNENMKKEIEKAKTMGDILIVSMNWGVEYTDKPTDRQIKLAHLAIDSGADLIIGNHPHWIQPVEFYKGKMIMYAHGNTIFDQMWSEKTKEGVIGRYTFYDKILIDVEFIPLYIQDYGQPIILEGNKKQLILDQLKNISTIHTP